MKINVNSRTNWLSVAGLADFADARLDQHVLTTSNVEFNQLALSGSLTIGTDLVVLGNATVNGNLSVTGNATIISSTITTIKDNIIVINANETGAGVSSNLSGIEVERGTLVNYQFVFDEPSQFFKIGQVGNLQVAATREETPLSYGAMVFNPVSQRLDSTQTFSLPMTFDSNTNSTTSSTGAVIVNNGIGAKGNVCIDGYYSFKGTNYANYIKSNTSNDFLLNVGNNLSIQINSGNTITIPSDVNLVIGSTTINSISNVYTINNGTSDINLTTSGLIKLSTNSLLQWGNSANNLTSNGTNVILNASSTFTINPLVNITNSNSNALQIAGGTIISNTTDSSSSSSGGTITSSGGGAFRKQLFVGDRLVLSDTAITRTQTQGQGVNFRSVNRFVSTSGNNDLTFNSFEGGSINSVSSVIQKASTVYIDSSPVVSGGGTIVRSYALYINSGDTYLNNGLVLAGTTGSTSYTTGALLLSGGVAINKVQNSVDHTNGGSLSISGGVAVGLDIYTGGKLDIGASSASITHPTLQGVNFRSQSRTLNLTGSNDIALHSFEGAVLNTGNTLTNACNVYISAAPTVTGLGSITNPYSLYINSGDFLTKGSIIIQNNTATTSATTGSISSTGGISSSNTTDSVSLSSGGSMTLAGGASIAKTVRAGTGYFSNNGLAQHYTLQNTELNRFAFNLVTTEAGSNTGSNLVLNRYDDVGTIIAAVYTVARDTGSVSFSGTTASTSNTVGSITTPGGVSISNTTNATSYTNGGSLTSAGGFAFNRDGYINGSLYVNTDFTVVGESFLAKTNVNTNTGLFNVTGSNGLNFVVGATSLIKTTTGNITLGSDAGTANVNGFSGINLTSSNSGVVLSAAGTSSFTTSSGTLTLTGVGLNANGGTGVMNLQNTNTFNVITTGAINLNTTNTVTGVRIGTTGSGVPVTLGDALSNTTIDGTLVVGGDFIVNGTTTTVNSTLITINDIAFVVNNQPAGLSDGGFLIRRYQPPNNTGLGEVVADIPKQSSTFGTGSAATGTLVLNASASGTADYYRGWWIKITSGAGSGQVRRIRSYNGTSKIALIYDDTNNNVTEDGLDLVTAPSSGDTYSLYDVAYAGMYYSASNREYRFVGVPFDQSSGVFGTPTSYLNIHVDTLVTETLFTSNGLSSIGRLDCLYTNQRALVVGRTGALSDADYNFIVNTTDGYIRVINPVSTVASVTGMYLQGKDLGDTVMTYSSVLSKIISNTIGAITSDLVLAVTTAGTSINLVTLNGANSTVDLLGGLVVNVNTATTSGTTGSITTTGGISSSNTTDAVSLGNGGSLTLLGGASITKKVFIGSGVHLESTNKVGSSNVLSGTQGNTNCNGDIVLYNSSSQGIYFNTAGAASPAYTTRSLGSKIILKPAMSGSSCDFAIGLDTTKLWNSVPTGNTFNWFLGTTEQMSVGSSGIQLPVNSTGLTFYDGTTLICSTNGLKYTPFSLSSSFVFANTAGTQVASVSSNGSISLAQTNVSAAPDSIFKINASEYTDTISSGTLSSFALLNVSQTTISATNTSTTTTKAISNYFKGAPIQGTNETFTNAYNMYLDQGLSLGTGITNGYTLYIEGPPLGTITNAYSVYVTSGKTYLGGQLTINDSTNVSGNSLTSTSGSVNTNGDLVLYNATKQTIYFNGSGSGVPSFTTRSSGSKLVLLPNTTGGTVDYAIGISSSSLWYSVTDSSANHSWYLGVTRKLLLDNTGLTMADSLIKNTSNANNISILGGNSDGGRIDLYGSTHATLASNVRITASTSGNIKFDTNAAIRLTIAVTGELILTNATDSTGTTDGSIYTPGGVTIDKSLYVNTKFALNFNQSYIYTGDVSGRLNIQSGATTVSSKIRYFTFDGNNSTDNTKEFYGLGTTGSLTNTEFLSVGFTNSNTSYTISTNKTGTGSVRPLILKTGTNTDQVKLNTDGSVDVNTGTLTTQKIRVTDATNSGSGPVGSLITDGGCYVAKDLIVVQNITGNGSLSVGVTSPSVTISGIVNSGAITSNNLKCITNTNEVLFSCVFSMTPTTANTVTSFNVTLPIVVTDFANLYDTVFTATGFLDNGSNILDIENIRAYPIIGTKNIKIIFTSTSVTSITHYLNVMIRYNGL